MGDYKKGWKKGVLSGIMLFMGKVGSHVRKKFRGQLGEIVCMYCPSVICSNIGVLPPHVWRPVIYAQVHGGIGSWWRDMSL